MNRCVIQSLFSRTMCTSPILLDSLLAIKNHDLIHDWIKLKLATRLTQRIMDLDLVLCLTTIKTSVEPQLQDIPMKKY